MLIVAAAIALVVVFAFAAASKISVRAFAEFERSIGSLWPGRRLLAPSARRRLAVAVVGAEILTVGALLVGAVLTVLSPEGAGWIGAGFVGAAVLMVSFTVGQATVLLRGRDVACACFGRSSTPVGRLSLLRNALLLAVSAVGLVLTAAGLDEIDWTSALPAAFAGSAVGFLVLNVEDIVDLFRPLPASTPHRG